MFDVLIHEAMWEAAIRLATPIALAALAALICARAGILYIGVEGIVLVSAFFSIAGTVWSGSIWVGVLLAITAGSVASVLLGFLSMDLAMGDVVAGIVYHFGAIGFTGFLTVQWFPEGLSTGLHHFGALWGDPGLLQPVLHQNPLVYIAVIATAGIAFFLRTAPGLRLRACGEAPGSAHRLGISVRRLRYRVYAAAGVLAGLSGAFLGLAVVGTFSTDAVAGRGYVALACVLLGAQKPLWVLLAAFFFGTVDAYHFQADLGSLSDWFEILPFVLTIIAATWVSRKVSAYETEESEEAAATT